jgi:hypothetical protein
LWLPCSYPQLASTSCTWRNRIIHLSAFWEPVYLIAFPVGYLFFTGHVHACLTKMQKDPGDYPGWWLLLWGGSFGILLWDAITAQAGHYL